MSFRTTTTTTTDANTAPQTTPPASDDAATLIVRDLGRMAYAEALALQRDLQRQVIAWRGEGRGEAGGASNASCLATPGDSHPRASGYLLLVEHDPPVITVSRRKTARQHLVATPAMLASAGVEVAETDRGGDITYHGPGQLVVYPILDLNRLGLRLHGYMRMLEQVVINVLARWEINGQRDQTATGVWVRTMASTNPSAQANGDQQPPRTLSKICAMGVRVSRWVSMHGLALNVTTNLDHFRLIVPCGLAGRAVTSMTQLLGEDCPSMNDVKHAMIEEFERVVHHQRASRPGDGMRLHSSSSPELKSKLMQ